MSDSPSDPAEYQSTHEGACYWFDYEEIDRRLGFSGESQEFEQYASKEECLSILQIIHYLLGKKDYRLRIDSAILALGAESMFYPGLSVASIAKKNKVKPIGMVLMAKVFSTDFHITDSDVRGTLIRFISIIINSKNYQLKLDTAIAATGLNCYQGDSFTDIAKRNGISKQAFDRHVLKFQHEFRLPPTRSQKTLRAREVYRQVAQTRSGREGSLN